MYRVKNETSSKLRYRNEEIAPGEEKVVMAKSKDVATFELETGKCDIMSYCGEHAASCEGDIICLPQSGGDSTIFTIKDNKN